MPFLEDVALVGGNAYPYGFISLHYILQQLAHQLIKTGKF